MTETDNEIMKSYKKRHGYIGGSQSPQTRTKLEIS